MSVAPRLPPSERRRRVPPEEWWRTEGGFFLLTEAHRAEEGPRAASFLESVLRLPPESRVLDMGCGWGRVALELAERGHRVVGVDCSRVLTLGRAIARQRELELDLVRADMRRWSSQPAFDAAILWGMSFGYFSDRQNLEVLRRVAGSLRPGGHVLLDLHHRDWYLQHYLGEHVELVQGKVCHDEASFDVASGRLNVLSTVADGRGKVLARQWHSFREYTLAEVLEHVRSVGLEPASVHASMDPRPKRPGPADSSWQVVGRRPRGRLVRSEGAPARERGPRTARRQG